MPNPTPAPMRDLKDFECLHYRDRFRAARYAALADAEGFGEICFALEALGLRLLGQRAALGAYKKRIGEYAKKSPVLNELARASPSRFKNFDSLYQIVNAARNDAMHLGAYARHATEAAIELCIGLEEALMSEVKNRTVANVMVKSPITVEPWQPIAHARQLMLMHSFSFLPVRVQDKWSLLSELGLAKFLNVVRDKKTTRLGLTIEVAQSEGLELIPAQSLLLSAKTSVDEILRDAKLKDGPMLWLVEDDLRKDHLAGVLSPFELM